MVLLTKASRDQKNNEKTKLFTELENINKLNKNITTYQKAREELDNLLLFNPNINKEKEQYEYNIKLAYNITSTLEALNKDNKLLEDKKIKEQNDKKELEKAKENYKNKEEKFKELDNYSKNVDSIL